MKQMQANSGASIAEPSQPKPDAQDASTCEEIKEPRVLRLSAFLSNVRKVAANGLLIVLFVFFTVIILSELLRSTIRIDGIQVPKKLEENGFTPEVVAQRLKDQIIGIQSDANSKKKSFGGSDMLGQGVDLVPNEMLTRFEVPGTRVTVKSLLRYAKDLLGLKNTYIGGNITLQGDRLQLDLCITPRHGDPTVQSWISDSVETLLHSGAREVFKTIDPYVLAVYLKHRDRKTALKLIGDCLTNEDADDDPWAYNLWGDMLRDEGEFEEAYEKYAAAIQKKSNFALAYTSWGIALAREGKREKAIDKFKKAIQIDPKYTRSYFQWGNMLQIEGKYQEAAKKFERVYALDPDNMDAYVNIGMMKSHQNKHDEAIQIFKKAILQNPNYAGSYFGWSFTLISQNKDAEAIEKLRKATELDPKLAAAHNNWGWVLLRQGNPEEAILQFKAAIALEADNADAYYNWGRALQKQNRIEEAIEKYKKTSRLNPKSYAYLKEEINRLKSMTFKASDGE